MEKIKTLAYIIIVLFLVANLYMGFQIQNKLQQLKTGIKPKKSLPCESIPLEWAVTNYSCANSLLLAMNVTNVKFNPPGTINALLRNRTTSIFKS